MPDELPFPVSGGVLLVGGQPLDRLALRAGGTPFYAYDRAVLSARVAGLRRLLPAGLRLHYSVKANPMPALVQHMAGLVDGFDVASAQELRTALDTAMDAASIGFAGPGKNDGELAMAIAAGITLHLESAGELRRAVRIGERLGIAPRAALRINPDFELRASGMKMSGGAKPFGIDAEQAPAVLRELGATGVEFVGFHIFCGSQNLRADAIAEAQASTLDLACRLADHAPGPVRLLNIGGGFGIPYFAGEQPLDVAAVAAHLGDRLPALHARLPEARVALELGRYLAGPAGVYVCRVIDRKQSRGDVFLVTDGGMHHHLAASGNLGQKIRKNYPLAVATRAGETALERVTVTGPLCTPLDVLAEDALLPRAEPGDLIAVFQSGAYGLSASPQAFLGHPAAVEMLV
jgi:diaminopimelate decarboxylase